jgi:uncharacterized membrane protein (DUF2068 family)
VSEPDPRRQSDRLLLVIGLFKLAKAALLVAVSAGAFRLLDPNTAEAVQHWTRALAPGLLHDPVRRLLSYLLSADGGRLVAISVASLFYAALFLVEGLGLCYRKRWAEYMTTIITGSLVPVEIYEIIRHATAPKAVFMVLNVAIVAYLIWIIRRQRAAGSSPAPR